MSGRTGIMLATMFTEKLFDKMPKPVFVQAKIEGDRLRAKNTPEDILLLSSGAKEVISVPHIGKELAESRLMRVELDGEMYQHGMRHSEIRSIVSRTKNLHPDHEKMQYYVFDIIAENEQYQRLEYLENIFSKYQFKYLRRVPYFPVSTLSELQDCYDAFLRNGYEGIIIRHPYATYSRRKVSTLLKLKPRVSDYFTIVEVAEEVSIKGERKNSFGAFVCTTGEGAKFSVGSGPTALQRALLWRNRFHLLGRKVKVRLQGYTKVRRVPKMQSIDKDWLIETQKILNKRGELC